jgi:hypothetical protein
LARRLHLEGAHAGRARDRRAPGFGKDNATDQEDTMKKVFGITMVLLVLAVGAGWAEEIKGTIKSVDATARVLTLADGTEISVAEGISMETLKEGVAVKVSYEERDGKKVATVIDAE